MEILFENLALWTQSEVIVAASVGLLTVFTLYRVYRDSEPSPIIYGEVQDVSVPKYTLMLKNSRAPMILQAIYFIDREGQRLSVQDAFRNLSTVEVHSYCGYLGMANHSRQWIEHGLIPIVTLRPKVKANNWFEIFNSEMSQKKISLRIEYIRDFPWSPLQSLFARKYEIFFPTQ